MAGDAGAGIPDTRKDALCPKAVPASARLALRLPALVMVALVGIGTVSCTALKILQWNRWEFGVWDGGIYLQALWLIARGHYLAIDTFFPTPKPIVADAGQWILYLLAPVLSLAGTWGLFFVQALALCSPAWVFFDIARQRLGHNGMAMALGTAYLFFPATVGMAVFDWHVDAIGVSLLCWALWAHATDRKIGFWPLLVLSLLSKNQAAIPILVFGLVLLLQRGQRRTGLLVAVLASLTLWVDEFLVRRQDSNIATFYAPYGSTLAGVVHYLLLHPQVVLIAVWQHIGYLLAMTLPLLLLPFLSPLGSAPALVVLLENVLSPAATLTSLYDQYAFWAVPFLFLGAIFALQRMRGRFFPLLAILWALLTLGNLLLFTIPGEAWRVRYHGPSAVLADLAARVPQNAVFYGQSGTAAHFYNRLYVGSGPFDAITSLWQLAASRHSLSPTYLLYAPGRSFGQLSPLSTELRNVGRTLGTGGFHLVARQDGIYLWASRRSPARLLRAERGGYYRFPASLLFPTLRPGSSTAFNAVSFWGGSYRISLDFRSPPPLPPSLAAILLLTGGVAGPWTGPRTLTANGPLSLTLPPGRLTPLLFQVSLPGADASLFRGIRVHKG